MLRTNLSTRPFYNERAVHALAALVALVAIVLTAWQVARVVGLSREKTELRAAIDRDRAESESLAKQAAQVRRGLDQKELARVEAAAAEANDLIARRTFSWTGLFNELAAALPGDVMLTSVRPQISDGKTQINLEIQGRNTEAIDEFWDRLDKTGQFHDVVWSTQSVIDEGLQRMQMRVAYSGAPR